MQPSLRGDTLQAMDEASHAQPVVCCPRCGQAAGAENLDVASGYGRCLSCGAVFGFAGTASTELAGVAGAQPVGVEVVDRPGRLVLRRSRRQACAVVLCLGLLAGASILFVGVGMVRPPRWGSLGALSGLLLLAGYLLAASWFDRETWTVADGSLTVARGLPLPWGARSLAQLERLYVERAGRRADLIAVGETGHTRLGSFPFACDAHWFQAQLERALQLKPTSPTGSAWLDLACPRCAARLEGPAIDLQAGRARCACGASRGFGALTLPASRPRLRVPRPARISVACAGRELRLRVRSLRWTHVPWLLAFPALLCLVGVLQWQLGWRSEVWFVLGGGLLLLLPFLAVLPAALSWPTLAVRSGQIVVKPAPLSLGSVRCASEDVSQLYVVQRAGRIVPHELWAYLQDGSNLRLLAGLEPAQAHYLEQRVEEWLGLHDRPMPGES